MHFDYLIEFFYANRQQSYKWMKKKYYILFCKKKKVKTTKLLNRKAENHKESLAQIKLMLEI